ncbi:hypothetical protein B0T17DRAFT_510227 [Bombardia bombarda]|uniref:DUF8035 domain-containing protein n=1 Tax=Bombardia bombarda TaxID=252184 RepID=A0AA39WHR9_9PEZI|nr:hypothetical protein B0T17DRAFT_510227 [Bombardia bombarda]
MAYRPSVPELDRLDRPERSERSERPARWDRDRFFQEQDRDRFTDARERERERFEEDTVYSRGPPSRAPSHPPPDRSVAGRDRSERRYRPHDDEDLVIRERRRVEYDEEPRARRRPSPPESDFVDRRVVIEKEKLRYKSPSPPRRPGQLHRRQSSLDTFDRKPRGFYDREEYGPPARRPEYRAPPYVPIPLPRSRALPPPRVFAERDTFQEIQVSDPHRFGDDDFHLPERVREKEIIRTRHRSRSRDSHTSQATSHRTKTVRSKSRASSSRSSSSSSSSGGGTTITTKSEYPKKGKTRIPARLVSKRALIDMGYPYIEEGNTIIVQKALGQHNIDDLLKLSDDYKKSELEVLAARSSAGDIIEERRTTTEFIEMPAQERRTEYIQVPAPQSERRTEYIQVPAPSERRTEYIQMPVEERRVEERRTEYVQMPVEERRTEYVQMPSPPPRPPSSHHPAPVIVNAGTPSHPPTEYVKTTTFAREVSPARSYTTASYSTSSYDTGTSYDTSTTATPYIVDARPREVSGEIPVGPLALVTSDRDRRRGSHHHDDIRSEIRHLEKQLARRERSRHERHSSRDLVKAERLSTGELVLLEETVERVEEPSRGVRIERDKKGPPPRLMKAMLATLT